MALADALEQAKAILHKDLQESSGPAQPLPPGLAEGHGLLVVEDGPGAEADLLALDDLIHGELDVFREQMELPAVDALHHFPAEEEAGAGDGAAGAQEHPGVV